MLLSGVLQLPRSRAVGALGAPLSHDHVDRPPTNTAGDVVHPLVGLKLGRFVWPPHEIGPPDSENLSRYEVPRVAAVYDVRTQPDPPLSHENHPPDAGQTRGHA